MLKLLKNKINAIVKWWDGEVIDHNEAGSPVIFMPEWRKPVLRKLYEWLLNFWAKEWKWIIPILVTIALGMLNHSQK